MSKENKSNDSMEAIRHSLSHLMSMAVQELYPQVGLGVGPAIEDGFYQDYDLPQAITPELLPKLEKRMRELIKENIRFEQHDVDFKEAYKFYKHDPYKTWFIDDLKARGEKIVSFYKSGWFDNLCAGPHVKSTKEISPDAFKLTKIAGAYWRGDEKNKMLQRIYGTAFNSEAELKAYLDLLEEAKKRDHKRLGKELDLFSFQEEGPGFPFFHDKGTIVWNTLVEFMRGEMKKRNYQENKTPIILNKSLWLQSGHWDHYKESMYFTKIDKADFAVKPMNCPGNLLIYKTSPHSYRDLPIRAGEFGLVHRHELSGVLNGLFRVRSFTQDDAHVFCTEGQLEDEIIALIDFINFIYKTFGFSFSVELSTKPENAMGSQKIWDKAESILEKTLQKKKMNYKVNPGDGAFYGPKIDFHLKDSIGRTWQCGTIQLDFSMPEKFKLEYAGEDGKKHQPVMLHRTIYGSIERFIGILIEHYAGAFPVWLAPVQVQIISVASDHIAAAKQLGAELEKAGIRAEVDDANETVGYKIRKSEKTKVPYMLVVGEKEAKGNDLSVRIRGQKEMEMMGRQQFIERVASEIKERK